MTTAVDSVIADCHRLGHRISVAGLASQRSSVVAWNERTGESLSPVIGWQDRRGDGQLAGLRDFAPEIQRRSGLPLTPYYGATKLHWLLHNSTPEMRAARRAGELRCGPLAAFLVRGLIGCSAVDHVNAARTQLLNIESLAWDPGLLDRFGVADDVLPTPWPTEHFYGELPGGIPLRLVTGDQNAALFAGGAAASDVVAVNVGSGAFICQSTGPRRIPSERLLASVLTSNEHTTSYWLEGTVNGAGLALAWAVDHLRLAGSWDHDRLLSSHDLPIFLNTVNGLGSPFWCAGGEPNWLSPRGAADAKPWQKLAAVLESVLFLICINWELMIRLAKRPSSIRISGGMAAANQLCQRLATLTGTTVSRPLDQEATARGAAWLSQRPAADWCRPAQPYFSRASTRS